MQRLRNFFTSSNSYNQTAMQLSWFKMFLTVLILVGWQVFFSSFFVLLFPNVELSSSNVLLINILLNFLTVFCIVLIYNYRKFKFDFLKRDNFSFANIKSGLVWGFMILLANMILGIIILLIYSYFGITITPQNATAVVSTTNKSNALIVFLAIVIAAPISEEIMFRGIIFRTFAQKTNVAYAIIISGLIFSLIHMDWYYIPQIWIMGILLAISYHKTSSIITPILAHMVINSIYFLVWFV